MIVFLAVGVAYSHVNFLKVTDKEEEARLAMELPANVNLMKAGSIKLVEIDADFTEEAFLSASRIFIAYGEDRVHDTGLTECHLFFDRKAARDYAKENNLQFRDYTFYDRLFNQ